MATMYGALCLAPIGVKNAARFKAFINNETDYGNQELEWWVREDGRIQFGSVMEYPNPFPTFYNPATEQIDEWDLEEFARKIRGFMKLGEEFRLVAAGNEKLWYAGAEQLRITATEIELSSIRAGSRCD
jgi:hypothetical protein